MHPKRLLTLGGVIAAAAVLITSAGAGTGTIPKVDLSTHSAAVKYLKSIGVDPKGVVIQRGVYNYAGQSCPGRGWSCTRSTRVFQIAATGGTNKFVCSDKSGTATTPPTTSNIEPLNCSITQDASTGNNVASCIEDESTNPANETCMILQTNVSGNNTASVNQKITQNNDASQFASETSTIDQQNGSGANTAQVAQDVHQNANAPGDQTQTVNQSSCVAQHGVETTGPCFEASVPSSGADKSNVNQSVTQNGSADKNSSQTQNDDIFGHVTQQTTGVATNQNTQNEHQNLGGGNGDQTQVGPLTCCSTQGINSLSKFNIVQMADQNESSHNPNQSDFLDAECHTFGICKATQAASENGTSAKNNCIGADCTIFVDCSTGGEESFGCQPGSPGDAAFVPQAYGREAADAAQRLLLRLEH